MRDFIAEHFHPNWLNPDPLSCRDTHPRCMARLGFGGVLIVVGSVLMLFQTAWAADPPPFVIRETFHQDTAQPQTDKSTVQHGIVGLDLLIREGYNPLVQDVFPGTPAERQGVLPGDIILTINGVSTLKKSINQVDAMISDQPGDGVTFLIKRGSKVSRVYLVVVALEALNPRLRSNFTGLFEPMP